MRALILLPVTALALGAGVSSDSSRADVEETPIPVGAIAATAPVVYRISGTSKLRRKAPLGAMEQAFALGGKFSFGAPLGTEMPSGGYRVETRPGPKGFDVRQEPPLPLALAPLDHLPLTSQATPSLFWHIEAARDDLTIFFWLARAGYGSPRIIEAELPSPTAAGIYRISLADYDVSLEPGVEYVWALVVDNAFPVSARHIMRVDEPALPRRQLTAALYAELGLWYDAFESLSDAIDASPQASLERVHRSELMRQGNLEAAATMSPDELAPEWEQLSAEVERLAEQGQYAEAQRLATWKLEIHEAALGPDHLDVAGSRMKLAELCVQAGDYARAVPLFERSLATVEKVLGPDHLRVADFLNRLVALNLAAGDLGHAATLLERSLAIRENVLGPEHPDVATSLNVLGELHHEMGDFETAEALYERSLRIRRESLGPDHPDVARVLNGLGALYHDMGDKKRASESLWRSLAIREKALGPHHPYVAMSLANLAALYHEEHDYERAQSFYERSLVILERTLGPEHPRVAFSLDELARLYMEKGDLARAAPLLERSLAILEKTLGREHPRVAYVLDDFASLSGARGDAERAQKLMARSCEIEERFIALLLSEGTEKRARSIMRRLEGSTYRLLSLQRANPSHVPTTRLGFETVLRRKGRSLDAVSGNLAALRRVLGPEEWEPLDALMEMRAQLARLVLRGPGDDPPERYRGALERTREELEVAERQAMRRGGALRAAVAPVRWQEVQSLIPAGGTLIELIAYTEFTPAPQPGRSPWGEERYGAYLLRGTGDPQWLDLGEASRIVEETATFRDALQNLQLPAPRLETAARALYDTLLAPMAAHLEGISSLLIAPDGVLNLIPFAALMDAKGRYLAETHTVIYLTSGRDLLRLSRIPTKRTAPIVIAAPDYGVVRAEGAQSKRSLGHGNSHRSRDLPTVPWSPLPGTLLEGEALARLLDVKPWTGSVARESAVKQAHGPRVLHIASHGFFLADLENSPPDIRSIGAPNDAARSPFSADWALGGEDPLLRSGLVLADANQLTDESEDGILTALEMAGLDLMGTQLVVLSACDTGLGTVENGEGVYGLRRALVIAGAQSQVTTLWKISDEATRILMEAYYKRLVAGEPRFEALRQVQLEFIADPSLRHPYYWASFIPIGAWGPLDLTTAASSDQTGSDPAFALLCKSDAGINASITDPRDVTQSADSIAGAGKITPWVAGPGVRHSLDRVGGDIIQWYYPLSSEPDRNTCGPDQYGIINPRLVHDSLTEGIVLRYGGPEEPRHYRVSPEYPSIGSGGVTLRWSTWDGHVELAQIGASCNIPWIQRTGDPSFIYARVSGQGSYTTMQAWATLDTSFLGTDWTTWGPAHCFWTDDPEGNAVDTGGIVGFSTEGGGGHMDYGAFYGGDAPPRP